MSASGKLTFSAPTLFLALSLLSGGVRAARYNVNFFPVYENVSCFGADIFHETVDDDDDATQEIDVCWVGVITFIIFLIAAYGLVPYFERKNSLLRVYLH